MSEISIDHRVRPFVLWSLGALAILIQAALYPRQSLWADEVFSLAMATGHSLEHPAADAKASSGDFVQGDEPKFAGDWKKYLEHESPAAGPMRVVRAVQLSDTSPPLYYLCLYAWTRMLGATQLSLRSFSVLCGLLCVPLLVQIASMVGPVSTGPIAVALFIFSPSVVYYFAEGRMYSLLWLCVLVTGWLTLRWRSQKRGFGICCAWTLASVGGLLVHYFFAFPWAAMAVFLWLRPGPNRRWTIVLSSLAVLALVLPWYVHLPESLGAWRITGDWLTMRPKGFSRLGAVADFGLQFVTGRALALWSTPRWAVVLAVLIVAFVALHAVRRLGLRVQAENRRLLWLWLIAAVVGPVAFDWMRGTYVVAVPRYALAASPAVCLLVAGALATLESRVRAALLVLLLGIWMISIASIYQWRWRNGSATREVAQAVAGDPQPGDLVLIHSIPSGLLGIAYYASPRAEIAAWVEQLGTRRVPESVEKIIAGRTRVRFVRIHDVGAPAPEENWLRTHARVERERKLGSAQIVDFLPREGSHF